VPQHGDHLPGRLDDLIDESEFSWSYCLVGEDQADKLARLTGDLRRGFSTDGRGKQITSGFSYWGIGPTIAWIQACADPFYLVMRESIASFPKRLRYVLDRLDGPFHYVSFGAGTGEKDLEVLRVLHRQHKDLLYVPVDLSAEMLRVAYERTGRIVAHPARQILPVQLDFAVRRNIAALKDILVRTVGDEPILYSLLGNTIANFEEDGEIARRLTSLLREQDAFLLEVATTENLSPVLADEAAEEYLRSRAYKEFVTSSLLHNTDLIVDTDSVVFHSSVENDRALLVRALYQNRTGHDIRMTVPDHSQVLFQHEDTILLQVTRKYLRRTLPAFLGELGTELVHSTHEEFKADNPAGGFGMDMLLLRHNPDQGTDSPDQGTDDHQAADPAELLWSDPRRRNR
jgi:L-histidine Nalpha-methyltransferase